MAETLEVRVHGEPGRPVLVYLPGLHGDWTLAGGFREALGSALRFVEIAYPRTGEWSLAAHAEAIDAALAGAGLDGGWLLGESFGSQVVWAWLASASRRFRVEGVILAGGFVRHPAPALVPVARQLFGALPARAFRMGLRCLAAYARWRGRDSPSAQAGVAEFLARRADGDRSGALHRLRLIEGADWRAVAAGVRVPVFYVTGFWDPIVPWLGVVWWLRRRVPGFGGWRLVLTADHNVLGSASRVVARQVVAWIEQRRPDKSS